MGLHSNLLEHLEPRRLLAHAVTLQPDGTLLVQGTSGYDNFQVIADIDFGRDNVLIEERNTDLAWSFPRADVARVLVETYGDVDALDFFGYGPLPPVTFHGGAGESYLNLEYGDYVFTEDAAVGNESLHVRVGWHYPSVRFETAQHLASLTVIDTRAQLTTGGNKTIVTGGLNPEGFIDLGTGNLIWDYPADLPWSALEIATSYTASGRAGGSWNGHGIAASGAAGSGLHGLGVAEASAALAISAAQTALFLGETVDATTILIRYTFAGDANLDRRIDADDYFQLDAGYAGNKSGYFHGDFNYDQTIDADDYYIIDANYSASQLAPANRMEPAPAAAFAASSPASVWSTLFDDGDETES